MPNTTKDKNNSRRKGWWLYQQDGASGHYYFGPLDDVQKTVMDQVENVVTFTAFPFKCTHKLHPTTGELMPATVHCVTSRALYIRRGEGRSTG